MLSNVVKFLAVSACVLCVGTASAHLIRRGAVVVPTYYVIVPADPCGCEGIGLIVDENRGTVSTRKVEIKREVKRERGKVMRDFPPLPKEEEKQVSPDTVQEHNPESILVTGEVPTIR